MDIPENIEFHGEEKARVNIYRSLSRTLLLADDTACELAPKDNTYMRIATPIIKGSQVASHMPVMGPRGADMIMEYIDAYLNTLM